MIPFRRPFGVLTAALMVASLTVSACSRGDGDRAPEAGDKKLLDVAAIHEFTGLDVEELEMVRAEIGELASWLGVELVEPR